MYTLSANESKALISLAASAAAISEALQTIAAVLHENVKIGGALNVQDIARRIS